MNLYAVMAHLPNGATERHFVTASAPDQAEYAIKVRTGARGCAAYLERENV